MRKRILISALAVLGAFLALIVGAALAQGPGVWLSSDPVRPGVKNLGPPDQPTAEGLNGDPEPEAAAPPGSGGEPKSTWSSSDVIPPGMSPESLGPPDQSAAVELDDDPEPVVVTSPGSRASDPAAALE